MFKINILKKFFMQVVLLVISIYIKLFKKKLIFNIILIVI